MKAWRQRVPQLQYRLDVIRSMAAKAEGDPRFADVALGFAKLGKSRIRVGRGLRNNHTRFKAVPSFLFQALMIRAGLMQAG